jgi:hypothetical protein
MKSSLLGSILAIVKVSKKKKKKQPLLSHRIRKVFLFFRASLSRTLFIFSLFFPQQQKTARTHQSIIVSINHPKKKEKKRKKRRETLKKKLKP